MRSLRCLILAALSFCACARGDGSVREGSLVKIHYTLIVDGAVRETSEGRRPLEYRAGSKDIVIGLDEALRGARVAEEKTIVIPAEKGYGPAKADEIEEVSLESLAGLGKIEPGLSIQGLRHGRPASARVRAVEGGKVTLDFNHELAGKTLTFKIRVVSVD